MKVYQVGPDQLSDYELDEIKDRDHYEWFVYWYEAGSYEGSGEGVAFGKDGYLYCKNLGHCSCYGPMDSWATDCTKLSVEDFLAPKESIFDYDCTDAIKSKVKELLPPQTPVFGDEFNFLEQLKD